MTNREDCLFLRSLVSQYHLYIGKIDDTRDKVNALKVMFHVLAGTVAGQEGKTGWGGKETPEGAGGPG